MTAERARRVVDAVYKAAFEEGDKVERRVYGGPINRIIIGSGRTSAQAWKDAASKVLERFPHLVVPS